jgi:hypothetical protein
MTKAGNISTGVKQIQAGCLILLFTLITPGCNSAELGRTGVDATLAALVPADATMLAGARMDVIRSTPLYKKLLAQKRLEQLDEFAQRTGFDPRRDVRELLIGSNGKDSIIAARGAFSPHAFQGVTKGSYKGYTLYTRDAGGVALIDSSTAVAGNLPTLHAVLDRYQAGSRSGPAALLSRARQIPPENQIWSVSSGFENFITGAIPQTGNAANVGRILQSLENTMAAADFRTGVNGVLSGLCHTEADAKNLGDAARGMAGLGRLSVPDNQPELLRVWDGIQVEQQQRTVKITVVIPENLLEKLIDVLGTQPKLRMPISRPASVQPRSALSSD